MRFYVYQIVVDGVVRYIGKGTGRRIKDHMKIVRSIARRRAAGETVTTTHFYNRLIKAWRAGDEIEFLVIADGLSEAEAFEREKLEIATASDLWNTAPGGEGYSAEQWADPEFRAQMKAREENKRTPEYRARRSAIAQSLWNNPDHRSTMIAAIWSPERRAKVEAGKREREAEQAARWHPYKSYREKQKAEAAERRKQEKLEKKRLGPKPNAGQFTSERMRGAVLSDEQRRKIAETNRETWSDPKLRTQQSESQKIVWLRPEYRAAIEKPRGKNPKMSEAAKKRWADPSFRTKMAAAYATPDFQEKRSRALKQAWAARRKTTGG